MAVLSEDPEVHTYASSELESKQNRLPSVMRLVVLGPLVKRSL